MKTKLVSTLSTVVSFLFAVVLIILPMQACSKSYEDHDKSETPDRITVKLQQNDKTIIILDKNDEITQVIVPKKSSRNQAIQCQLCTPELIKKYSHIGKDCKNIRTSTLVKKIFEEYESKYKGEKKRSAFKQKMQNTDKLSEKMMKMTKGVVPTCSSLSKDKNISDLTTIIKLTSFGSHRCEAYWKIGGTVLVERKPGCGAWNH